jgi:pyridoxamine 5'-phosphate oxidase
VLAPLTRLAPLEFSRMAADPLREFARWFKLAAAHTREPEAMTLATATRTGRPSARMVLLKRHGPEGFEFYTNYASRKGRELADNPRAALVLHWPAIGAQVRIEGRVRRLSATASDAYFASRDRASQISATASPQSRVIADRRWLEAARDRVALAGASAPIRRPRQWGGYRLSPERVEFWRQGESRLHDRILYRKTARGWKRERLAP